VAAGLRARFERPVVVVSRLQSCSRIVHQLFSKKQNSVLISTSCSVPYKRR
jgi:hypothetical protein